MLINNVQTTKNVKKTSVSDNREILLKKVDLDSRKEISNVVIEMILILEKLRIENHLVVWV